MPCGSGGNCFSQAITLACPDADDPVLVDRFIESPKFCGFFCIEADADTDRVLGWLGAIGLSEIVQASVRRRRRDDRRAL